VAKKGDIMKNKSFIKIRRKLDFSRHQLAMMASLAVLVPVVFIFAFAPANGDFEAETMTFATTTPSPSPSPTPTPSPTPAPTETYATPYYYVDCSSGSDSNAGSSSSPWKTPAAVSSRTLSAGTVFFKRGCSWNGSMTIKGSGTAAAQVGYATYGTGAAPVISASGQSNAISVTGDYNQIDGFYISGSISAGVILKPGADHNVVKNTEVTASGLGVETDGQYNLITRNNVHDLHMIVNTQGGDDDYGAVCFWVAGPNNEVSYNKGTKCDAPSYDYGSDGGFVEIWQQGDNTYVHHNIADRTNGFFEIGGSGSARNIRVAYNVINEVGGGALCLHTSGTFTIAIDALRFENNTFMKTESGGYRVFDCMSSMTPQMLTVRNNIFYSNISISPYGTFTHSNNLYYMVNMINGSGVGYTLSTGEKTGDPKFVSAQVSARNLHLQAGSPAIDGAVSLGYTADIDGIPVPSGAAPDMGAYEYRP
jgi:hypothetical protein